MAFTVKIKIAGGFYPLVSLSGRKSSIFNVLLKYFIMDFRTELKHLLATKYCIADIELLAIKHFKDRLERITPEMIDKAASNQDYGQTTVKGNILLPKGFKYGVDWLKKTLLL